MLRNLLGVGLAFGVLALPAAEAASLQPWVGTADYTAAPSATGDEDAAVGPFDRYDFGTGAALIQGALGTLSVDQVLTGAYQSYVSAHEYISGGGGTAAAPNLNTTGAGAGYELTVAATFNEKITSISGSGSANFDILSGTANLYFDTSPDFSFAGDSGFNDVDAILQGTIVGGTGTLLSGTLGVTSIEVRIDAFDSNVFDPDTIAAGTSIFTLQITPADASFLQDIRNGADSVQNIGITGNDLLLAADGNLDLLAVPEPLSVLLVGSAVGGLVVIRRRSQG